MAGSLSGAKAKKDPPPADCPLEDCLKLLSGAWTPKILWFLREEPRRFGELKRDLGGISSKVLTARLREMEEQGVVNRKILPTSPPSVEYSLTDIGKALEPILDSMVDVAKRLRRKGLTS